MTTLQERGEIKKKDAVDAVEANASIDFDARKTTGARTGKEWRHELENNLRYFCN